MNDVLDIVRAQRPDRPTLDAATRTRLRARVTGQLGSDAPAVDGEPAGSPLVPPDDVVHHADIGVGEVREGRSQGARWLTVAAGMVVVVAGVWWLTSAQDNAPVSTAAAPTIATSPNVNPVSTLGSTPPTSAQGQGPYPLDDLDPLEAARRVSLAARIGPTPDEYADLAIAG